MFLVFSEFFIMKKFLKTMAKRPKPFEVKFTPKLCKGPHIWPSPAPWSCSNCSKTVEVGC